MANPTTVSAPKAAAPVAAVTPEVTTARGADVDAARARFVTTTGDAPISNGPTNLGKLNAKTLAEHAAGKRALAQYAPASE